MEAKELEKIQVDICQPTIFDDVKPENTIFSEEVFGPVLGITTFKDPEEGIALANQNKYGLAASVFTSSNKTAHVAARKIKAGTVAVNCYGEGDITTPFGGYKLSGFGGRDKSLAAHDQYCELKNYLDRFNVTIKRNNYERSSS